MRNEDDPDHLVRINHRTDVTIYDHNFEEIIDSYSNDMIFEE